MDVGQRLEEAGAFDKADLPDDGIFAEHGRQGSARGSAEARGGSEAGFEAGPFVTRPRRARMTFAGLRRDLIFRTMRRPTGSVSVH